MAETVASFEQLLDKLELARTYFKWDNLPDLMREATKMSSLTKSGICGSERNFAQDR